MFSKGFFYGPRIGVISSDLIHHSTRLDLPDRKSLQQKRIRAEPYQIERTDNKKNRKMTPCASV